MLYHRQQILTAADSHDIQVQSWLPDGEPRAVIQILHGLGEHANRYARFADAATQRGHAVYVHDHRGHGEHCDELGHFADANGWHKVNSDAQAVNDLIRELHVAVPIVLLGHSLGSYVAQTFAMHHGARLSGLILSASTWPSRMQLAPALLLAYVEAWRLGIRGNSARLDKLGFGNFNRPFEPARTELDWLSRDEAEVDVYIADPLCGGPYSCALWRDVIGGLLYIARNDALRRIPAALPLLISGGASDPVGGDKGMTRLAMRFAQTEHQRITVKIYPDGRHESLHEINRDEVTGDWLSWIADTTGT